MLHITILKDLSLCGIFFGQVWLGMMQTHRCQGMTMDFSKWAVGLVVMWQPLPSPKGQCHSVTIGKFSSSAAR